MEWLDSWRDSWTDDLTAADPFAAQSDEIELDDAREQPDEQDDLLPLPPGLKRRAPGESSASLPEFEPRRTGRKRRPSTAFDDYETTSPPSSPVKPAAEKRSLAAKPPSANPKRQRPNTVPTPPRSNGSRDTRAARSLSSTASGSASSSDLLPTNGAASANQAAKRNTANGRLEAMERASESKPMSRNGQAWTAEEDSRLYAAVTEHRQENSDRFPAIWQFAPGDDPTWIAIHARFITTGETSARAERTQYALRGRWKNIRLRELAARAGKGASSSTLGLNKHATGSAAQGVEAGPSVAECETPETPITPRHVEPAVPAESSGTMATRASKDMQQGAVAVAEQNMIDLESTAAKQQNEIFSSLLSDEGMAAMSAPDTPTSSVSSGGGTEMQSVDTTSMMMESPPSSIADSSPSGFAAIPLSLDMSSTATCTTATSADEALGYGTRTTPVGAPEMRAFPDGLPPFVVASFGRREPKDKYCGPPPVVPDRGDVLPGPSPKGFAQESSMISPASNSSPPLCAARDATPPANLNALLSQRQPSLTVASAGPRSRKLWTGEHDAKAVEMRGRGCSHSEIATALGRTSFAVKNRFQNLRLDGRAPPVQLKPATSGSEITPNSANPVGLAASLPSTAGQQEQTVSAPPATSPAAGTSIAPLTETGRWTAEADASLLRLRASGLYFASIGQHLNRTARACNSRYHLLCNKAQTSGTPLPTSAVPARKSGIASNPTTPNGASPLPTLPVAATPVATPHGFESTPAARFGSTSVPVAASLPAPLPPYTAEDDGIILRMSLQGASAESIALALRRSVKSVQRRWTKKKSEWIAQGLVSSSSHLKAKNPVTSGSTLSARPNLPTPMEAAPTVDPFADLRTPESSTRDVLSVAEAPVATNSSNENADEELANDFGGFDGSFYADEGAFNRQDVPVRQGVPLAAAGASDLDQTGMTESAARDEDTQVSEGAAKAVALSVSDPAHDGSTGARTIEADPFMAKFETGMRGLNRFMQLMRR